MTSVHHSTVRHPHVHFPFRRGLELALAAATSAGVAVAATLVLTGGASPPTPTVASVAPASPVVSEQAVAAEMERVEALVPGGTAAAAGTTDQALFELERYVTERAAAQARAERANAAAVAAEMERVEALVPGGPAAAAGTTDQALFELERYVTERAAAQARAERANAAAVAAEMERVEALVPGGPVATAGTTDQALFELERYVTERAAAQARAERANAAAVAAEMERVEALVPGGTAAAAGTTDQALFELERYVTERAAAQARAERANAAAVAAEMERVEALVPGGTAAAAGTTDQALFELERYVTERAAAQARAERANAAAVAAEMERVEALVPGGTAAAAGTTDQALFELERYVTERAAAQARAERANAAAVAAEMERVEALVPGGTAAAAGTTDQALFELERYVTERAAAQARAERANAAAVAAEMERVEALVPGGPAAAAGTTDQALFELERYVTERAAAQARAERANAAAVAAEMERVEALVPGGPVATAGTTDQALFELERYVTERAAAQARAERANAAAVAAEMERVEALVPGGTAAAAGTTDQALFELERYVTERAAAQARAERANAAAVAAEMERVEALVPGGPAAAAGTTDQALFELERYVTERAAAQARAERANAAAVAAEMERVEALVPGGPAATAGTTDQALFELERYAENR